MWPLNFQLFSVFEQTEFLNCIYIQLMLNSGYQKSIKKSSHTIPDPVEHFQIKWGKAYGRHLRGLICLPD